AVVGIGSVRPLRDATAPAHPPGAGMGRGRCLAPSPCANGLLVEVQHIERPWHITLMHERRAVMGVPPDLVAFHVGIVVRDLQAAMDPYPPIFPLEHGPPRDPKPGTPLPIA